MPPLILGAFPFLILDAFESQVNLCVFQLQTALLALALTACGKKAEAPAVEVPAAPAPVAAPEAAPAAAPAAASAPAAADAMKN